MSKILCYSVRLQSLTSISDKCYKATGWDGSEDLIPKSQVFGRDWEVTKSEAHWISQWILSKKSLQYSGKKERWFDSETRNQLPTYTFEKHIPNKVEPINIEADADLIR